MDKIRNGFQTIKEYLLGKTQPQSNRSPCQFITDHKWLDLQFNDNNCIKKPNELENEIEDPPGPSDQNILNRIQGSLIGLALGDALGAHVEFRPHQYLLDIPVTDLQGGGTWNLCKGQFTDDTSMALCLANSLIARQDFLPYDQLVRYKWWYQHGYMSSNGTCFDIGTATRQSLDEFIRRQHTFAKKRRISIDELDYLSDDRLLQKFKVYCSDADAAGNGALMRLAPVPLFFYKNVYKAIEFSGYSGQITHGSRIAYDACRYYAALIVAALNNYTKDELLDKQFYRKNRLWFGEKPLCEEIRTIAEGSFKREGGYEDGIRGKGYIVSALEAALWAFWSDNNSFEKGVLAAVNLGDDTDTTAAIYGQLAGAYYGYKNLPKKWIDEIYAKKFILQLSKWIEYEGNNWKPSEMNLSSAQYPHGTVSAHSTSNLYFGESTISNSQSPSKIPPKTEPLQRKQKFHNTILPNKKPVSVQNPYSSNAEISHQCAPLQYEKDNATSSRIPWKQKLNVPRSSTKISTPRSHRKNPN